MGDDNLPSESTVGWLKLFFSVFTSSFVFLIIAYYTLDKLILGILAIIGGVLAIISLMVAYIISRRENIQLRRAKINWEDVADMIHTSRRR